MSTRTCQLCGLLSTTIGRKLVVAVTGIILVGFLAGHLSGNLLIFVSEEAFNDYATFLQESLHGAGVWIARIGLLTAFVVHIWFTILLVRKNRAARVPYADESTVQASKSSRIMIWSGLTILSFVIFHILHFTVRVSDRLHEIGELNPHKMVVVGFQNPLVVLFYLISMTLLCSHLAHGVGSIFETLGLRTDRTAPAIKFFSLAYAWIIYLGFISIPIAIFVFGFGD